MKSCGGPAGRARGVVAARVLDTNILVRHLTGDPPEMARQRGRLLASGEPLLVADLVLAECV